MKFANKTSYAVAMLLSTGEAIKFERMPRRLDTTFAAFADQTWDFSDNTEFINKLGSTGYMVDRFLIDDAPDMQGGMRDFSVEKDGVKKNNVGPVAEELNMAPSAFMFTPEELKQPDEEAKEKEEKEPKAPVDEPEAEIDLQIDYLQQQHEDHLMQLQFESSEDAENNFNDDLAKINGIKKLGETKFLTQYKRDDPMFFVPRKADVADGTKQMLNSIADDGEAAEEQMDKDIKESDEAEAKAEAAPKAEAALQTGDESSVILGSLIADGDSAEDALNAPAVPEQAAVQKAPVAKKDEDVLDYDASDVQITFVDLAVPAKKPAYKGLSQVQKGDVAGVYLSSLLGEGAQAEQNIEDQTPEGAVAKQNRDAALAQKNIQEEDGQFYDDSEVQVAFVGQNLDKVNDDLAKYKKSTSLEIRDF